MSRSEAVGASAPVNKWLVTASIGLGALMSSISTSSVNVALPQMRGSVGASVQEITWVVTAYMIALIVIMPLTGFLGRLFGQKRLYLTCLLVFIVGSLLGGMSTSLGLLVAARLVQGLGGGALMPVQQAILYQTFPKKEQAMAMAIFGMVAVLGPAIGPTLGGYIVDNWHWSWIFFINVPVGIAAVLVVARCVREDPEIAAANARLAQQQRKSVDWTGIGLLAVGLAALQYFLEEGQRDDWFDSRVITASFLVALVSLAAFVARELTTKVPAVNLRLFSDGVFSAGTLIGGLMYGLLTGGLFLLPLFMQELLGFTAVQSGIALLPRALAMMVGMPLAGRLYNLLSARVIIAGGIGLVVLGSWQLSGLTLQSGEADFIVPNLCQGIGFALQFVPLTTAALSNIPRHRLQDGTGLNSLLRQLGGAIGISVFATLLTKYTVVARAGIIAHLDTGNVAVQERLKMLGAGLAARGMDATTARSAAVAALSGISSKQAVTIGFERVLLLSGLLFIPALPLLVLLKTKKDSTRTAESEPRAMDARHANPKREES